MTNYNLERIKKIDLLLLPQYRICYIEALATNHIEHQAIYLSKIGELELELNKRISYQLTHSQQDKISVGSRTSDLREITRPVDIHSLGGLSASTGAEENRTGRILGQPDGLCENHGPDTISFIDNTVYLEDRK